MTKKQEYVIAMKKAAKGADFITIKELCTVLGVKKPDSAKKYVDGLTRLGGRRYFIPEVADLMVADTR